MIPPTVKFPAFTAEQTAALNDLRRAVLETGRDLRNAAARLDEAERRVHRAGITAGHRPAGHLSDQFAALHKAILDSLPHSWKRDNALQLLSASRDRVADAALDTTGPEDAA